MLFRSLWAANAEAQTKTVRLAKQFGISYLPLTIMEEKKLLEEQAKKLGVEVRTEWLQLSAGSPMNEALISDRKSTRLNSSHANISYAVFCLKKKKNSEYCNHTP